MPPLNALRAFEVAGRHQSIRRAASELGVTPGAVSRQVRLLESWLGLALFHRDSHAIVLTRAGSTYLAAIGSHLDAIVEATALIADMGSRPRLRVRTWSMLSTWLVPRLSDFRRLHPEIDLEIIASGRQSDFQDGDFDIEITGRANWGDGASVGRPADDDYDVTWFKSSPQVCVCSPRFLEQTQLAEPADLVDAGDGALLCSLASPDLWTRWLEAAGVEGLQPGRGQILGDSQMVAVAAIAGQGVAIIPTMIFAPELDAGSLVQPFKPDVVECEIDFFMSTASGSQDLPHVVAFRDWLLGQRTR